MPFDSLPPTDDLRKNETVWPNTKRDGAQNVINFRPASNKTFIICIVVVGLVVVLCIACVAAYRCYLRRKTRAARADVERGLATTTATQVEREDNCNLEDTAISGAQISNTLGGEGASPGNGKISSLEVSKTSVKDNSYLEAKIDVDTEEPAAESAEHLKVKNQIGKSSFSLNIVNEDDSPSESHYDDVVKICDICGDAGLEDLLAICSRCNDRAEHTYCMRIMMDTVPRGNWVCEGCQLKEEDTSQKRNNAETPSSSN